MKAVPFQPKRLDPDDAPVRSSGKNQEIVQTLAPGDPIFSAGDPGGDLLFIEAGSVEVYIEKNGQEIHLAKMEAGEILGVMTFVTRGARMASARALSETRIKKIPSTQVQRYIATFPRWLKIVLKEFVGRIDEMNRRYSETQVALKKARDLQITPLFLATQMAQALVVVGRSLAKDKNTVMQDELCQTMQHVLNQPKEMIQSLFRVFLDTGLLVPEQGSRNAFSLEALDRVGAFTGFVRDSAKGPTRKLLRANITAEDLKLLKAMVRVFAKSGIPGDKTGSIKASEFTEELRKDGGVTFVAEWVARYAETSLLKTSGDGPDMSVSFMGDQLSLTLSCLEIMQTLVRDIDRTSKRMFPDVVTADHESSAA